MYHSTKSLSAADNKYMKDYDKNKESPYLKYWDVNNLQGCTMSQRFIVGDFKWVEDIFALDENLQKVIEKGVLNIFLNLLFNIVKRCMNFTTIYHFYQKE